jgi:ribonucleoside-diphosphate reductase beta chain
MSQAFETDAAALFLTQTERTLPLRGESSKPARIQLKAEDAIRRGTPATDHIPEHLRIVRFKKPGGDGIIEELLPLRYPIYDELWTKSYENNWKPESIGMDIDLACWKAAEGTDKYLDPNTRHMVLTNLSFFGTAEQLIGDNAISALAGYITMPEVRNQLMRLAFEESIHSRTFAWIISNLGLSCNEIYQGHKDVPCIAKKDQFMKEATQALTDRNLDLTTREGRRTFMEALLAQIIMEGVLFYGGFVMNLSLQERSLMPGLGQQYAYIMRDESLHLLLMRELFNHFKDVEWPDIWDHEFEQYTYAKFEESVGIENDYARYALSVDKGGVPGLLYDDFTNYNKFLVNRRLEFIGLNPIYANATNPFHWLEKRTDLVTNENFFETHRTEYTDGGGGMW